MKTILVVDDSLFVRNLLTKNLGKNKNYRVITAEDGEVALELVRRDPPDLIILDIILPRVNGIAFLKTLRKTQSLKDTPVILMSGVMVDDDYRQEGLSLGALDYLTKPFDMDWLIAKVDSVLSG